jgi:uncharacterized OsmC-like protein
MKAVVGSAGKVSSRVRVGRHELIFDQPAAVPGGGDRGPSPLDVLGIAVGACAHYYAAAYLFARNLPTDALTVEVESEKTRSPRPRLGRLVLTVRVPAGLSELEIAGIERAVKACPAYGTMVSPPDVTVVVETALPGAGERRSA